MAVDDITLNNLAGANTAVVRALGGREAIARPAVGAVVEIEEGVLLLETYYGLVKCGERRCRMVDQPNQGSCAAWSSMSFAHSWR